MKPMFVNKKVLLLLATVLVATFFMPAPPVSANATTFVVNSAAHRVDANPGDGNCDTGFTVTVNGVDYPECTLRAAIDEANTTPALDNIHFNILNSNGSCPSVATITPPNTTAPNYVDSYSFKNIVNRAAFHVTRPVVIDGYTQCNASPNSQADGSNTVLRIEVRGASSNAVFPGIVLHGANSSGSTIRGLAMSGFGRGQISVVFSGNHIIEGNFLGLRANGSGGGGNIGVFLYHGTNTIIGGTTLAARNHVAGVGNDGIHFEIESSYNHIIGNYFSLAPDGKTRRANGSDTIDFQAGVTHNWIGGIMLDAQGNPILDENGRTIADPNKRNIMSGGTGDAIEFTHTTPNGQNHVVGNWIGLNAFANENADILENGRSRGNGQDGINIEDHFNGNYVYQNIIVNSGENGITIWSSDNNHIYDNWIGIRPAGETLGGVQFGEALMGNGPTGTNIYNTNSVSKGINGIYLIGGSDGNIIERNHIVDNGKNSLNTTNGLGYGIWLSHQRGWIREDDEDGDGSSPPEDASATCSHHRNRISQNSFYGNHHFEGIHLTNGADCLLLQAFGMQKPTMVNNNNVNNTHLATVMSTQRIKVGNDYQNLPCVNCTVELFINSDIAGTQGTGVQGKTYLASGLTDSTGKAIIVFDEPLPNGTILVATAIDPLGNTSAFSSIRTVNAPPNVACTTAPTATTTSVSKTAENVQLNWNSVAGASFYRVYRSSDPAFTPSEATLLAQVNSGTSYVDAGQMTDNTPAYYVVVGVNACVQESAVSNRVGKAVLTVWPGQNILSLPVVPSQSNLNYLFGNQLTGTGNPLTADQVRVFNNETKQYLAAWHCAGDCATWGAPWANNWLLSNFAVSQIELTIGTGFWVNNRGTETKYIKIVGVVPTGSHNINIYNRSNLLGVSFTTSRTVDQLGLPATGTTTPETSNRIRYWNASTQTYQTAWYCNGCGGWLDMNTLQPTPIVIQPGTGFWFENATNGSFTWQSQ